MTTVRRKSPKKSSILTLRDAMAKPKLQMTAVAHAVSDQAQLEPTVVPARKKRPTVSDVKISRINFPYPRCLVPNRFLCCVNNSPLKRKPSQLSAMRCASS